METYVISGELAVKFRRWLIATGQYQVVKNFEEMPAPCDEVTVQRIMELVAFKYLKGDAGALTEKTNRWHVSRPRQIASYLARKYTSASLPRIAMLMGGMHHTTILYGIETVEDKMRTNPQLAKEVAELEESLKLRYEATA